MVIFENTVPLISEDVSTWLDSEKNFDLKMSVFPRAMKALKIVIEMTIVKEKTFVFFFIRVDKKICHRWSVLLIIKKKKKLAAFVPFLLTASIWF